ncbi:MAG: glycoside hydrolase family 2 TIM barrel-domain containing protein, partial [Candidatus Izemoplasmatales bacterium]|nr:glycoside hydrolase family 2 TIM barrel-domain containing protein [Candidatus Izemoplasmatales bacterium]
IYHKEVVLPEGFLKDKLILHFGAVDQEAKVYINDELVKCHLGGFTPFKVDIENFVENNHFALKVVVNDITDTSFRQTGKQRIKRGGIFYTPQSGIWQTVWLESVPKSYIKDILITTDFDAFKAKIKIVKDTEEVISGKIKLIYKNKVIHEQDIQNDEVEMKILDMKSWTPESPNLYDFEISYGEDLVQGYFGMRKFERKPDKNGIMRFYLNNKPYFLSGVLDQGYYPDGLLTNPSDEAYIYDILTMKDYGFNFLRKHIKIESLRWYYHCDRLGMIVWQDMINGSTSKDVKVHHVLSMLNINLNDKCYAFFGRKDKPGRIQYMIELDEMLNYLKNITCISTWVPFNESWGQFHALDVERHVRKFDSTRLIDHASGWSDRKGGDYHSRHFYFKKFSFPIKKAKKRILALTEFGGYSLRLREHSFNPEDIFGYKIYNTEKELNNAVEALYVDQVYPQIKNGLNVLVYTQVSDVEDEVNGFFTYDREILKIDIAMMKQINKTLSDKFIESCKR